ncbi:MAG: class I SAM-dependent methyltransferase [Actinomycetota bacterium]|nr:class I SAM-dependent methyltransferase [Actinomycetota bacterium]
MDWYHTIDLPGQGPTPGYFDTRGAPVPLPERLDGKRCLDVGTYDGYWAFEMERRGAADVVAIDVLDPQRWDWPGDTKPEVVAAIAGNRRTGAFEAARDALGSRVRRRDVSVYDISPVALGGFDVVYCGSLTVHLRDPVGALMAIRRVCRGILVLEDVVDVPLSALLRREPAARLDGRGRPWWWRVNAAGLARMAEAAGFEVLDGPRRFSMPYGAGGPNPKVRPRRLHTRGGREEALLALRGDPHAALLARPRTP